MKYNNHLQKVIALVLTIVALMVGQGAWAQTFTIQASHDNSTNKTTFTITRTSNTSASETVRYRTVSLSAIAGQHFDAKSGEYTFDATHNSYEVEVTEHAPTGSDAYKYQNGSSRYYRFEVLDTDGFYLAHKDRDITTGLTQFDATKVSSSITDLVKFSNGSLSSGMSSDKYVDVSYNTSSNSNHSMNNGYFEVDDEYYYGNQTLCNVSTSSLISSTNANRSYLTAMGAKIYATVCFTMKEANDGYQYIQILTDNSNSWDCGTKQTGESAGSLKDPSTSIYKALFEMDHGSSANTSDHKMFFPHRYDTNTSSTEFDYSDAYLYEQKFKSHSPSYRAANSGSLVLAPTVETINVRFDCAGENNDTYWVKDLKVRMALCDEANPTLISTTDIAVSSGPYNRGCDFYISVPFSEIVNTVNSGYKKLETTWGDAIYFSGDGSNVITFKGTINASAGTTLAITSLQCGFKDLAGKYYQGNTDSFDKTFTGITSADPTYSITYDLAGGTLASANPSSFTYTSSSFTLNNPTRTGYTFDGWTGSNGDTPETTITIANHSYGNRSYTANWTLITYDISYDLAGGTVAAGLASSYTIETPTFTLVNPTRTGYTFDGWTGSNGDTPETTVTISKGSTGPLSYTANWTAHEYTVHFDANGGTGTMNDMDFTYDEAQNLTANAFTGPTYYLFTGWNTEANGSGDTYTDGQSVSNLTPDDNGSVTLYALWTPDYAGLWHADDKHDGSSGKPYIITTPEGLGLLASLVNGGNGFDNTYFQLGANIEYTGDSENYTAIGTVSNPFNGTFNGDGKIVSGIRINKSGTDYQALFGYVGNSGTVKNVTLTDVVINGGSNTGAVVGNNAGTLSANYYHGCTVNNQTTNIGTGAGDTGGACIVYTITLGTNITATNQSVKFNDVLYYAANATVTLGYSQPVAQRITYHYNDGSDHDVTGNTFTMPDCPVTVSGVSFTDVWSGSGNNSVEPYLITTTDQLDFLAKMVNGSDGYTANKFEGKFFQLGNDITYTHTTEWNDANSTENNYTAIGCHNHSFQGYFDGGGHTVRGIRIYKGGFSDDDKNQGLFGYTYKAKVQDVTVDDARITGHSCVGGITGESHFLDLTNCHVTNTVAIHAVCNEARNHGGLVGWNNSDGSEHFVIECTSAATISMAEHLEKCFNYGGIIGNNMRGIIKNCFAYGVNVNGTSGVGAIVGYDDTGTFESNYYHGCTVNNKTSDIGINYSDQKGASIVYALNLPPIVTATTAAVTHKGTNYYTEGTAVTLSYESAPPGFREPFLGYSLNGTPLEGNTFTMPANDVTVIARWFGIDYVDRNGNVQTCTDYTVLTSSDGGQTHNNAGWYVVVGDVTIGGTLDFGNNNAYLILCDGATLTVNGGEGNGIYTGSYLIIYGQSGGTGTVSATGKNDGINTGIVTINGGSVTASGNRDGINTGDVIINGGSVSATGNADGIYANYVKIYGGSVSATGNTYGINAISDITLGWTHASDRIYASSYYTTKDIIFETARNFTDGTAIYNISLNKNNLDVIAGKTLMGVDVLDDSNNNETIIANLSSKETNIYLNNRTLYKDGAWNTLCLPFDVSTTSGPLAGDDVVAMTLDADNSGLSGSTLTLNFTAAETIPAGTPFIIKWGTPESHPNSDLVNPVFPGVTINNSASTEVSFTGGTFKGTYNAMAFTDENKSILFLGYDAEDTEHHSKLYYPESGARIYAFRSYFQLTAPNAVKDFRLNFGEETSTGIAHETYGSHETHEHDAWYDLQGRQIVNSKLSNRKISRGLYIHNGKKIYIK